MVQKEYHTVALSVVTALLSCKRQDKLSKRKRKEWPCSGPRVMGTVKIVSATEWVVYWSVCLLGIFVACRLIKNLLVSNASCYIFGKLITFIMFASPAVIWCEVPSYPSSLYTSQ
jgi:hypothetical protein